MRLALFCRVYLLGLILFPIVSFAQEPPEASMRPDKWQTNDPNTVPVSLGPSFPILDSRQEFVSRRIYLYQGKSSGIARKFYLPCYKPHVVRQHFQLLIMMGR